MATLTLTTAVGTATQTLSTGARGPAGSGGGGGGSYTAGTGLTLTTGAFAIDSTVATLTGTQTLTNKTIGDVLTTGMQTFAPGSMAYFDAGSEVLFDGGFAYFPNGAINLRGTGATAYNLTFNTVDPTSNRTITFPDATGTIALTTDIPAAPTTASLAAALNAGTQDLTAADTDRLAVTSPAGGWMLLSTLWTWLKTKLSTSGDTITVNGPLILSSATRPTTSGTGTPEATSLMTQTDVVNQRADPSNIIIVEDFIGGTSVTATAGETGVNLFSSGGGTGAAIANTASSLPNLGVRTITCGNATNAGYTIYYNPMTSLLTGTGWELCFVVKLNQTTDCDLIVGITKDPSGIGIGKFGGISFGARYSSASDTNFMFYSKNTNTDFAANDANNYAVSSGVAVGTTYNTFRIRSVVAGSLQMSINGGSWVAVPTSTILTSGSFIPFFYIATRTTTSKSIDVDFFSLKIQGVAR